MVKNDIQNGYMVMSLSAQNRWQTFIEGCLIKDSGDGPEHAFLASACRSEFVTPTGPLFGEKIA